MLLSGCAQEPALFQDLTVIESLEYVCRLKLPTSVSRQQVCPRAA